jgi:hypothetical protein
MKTICITTWLLGSVFLSIDTAEARSYGDISRRDPRSLSEAERRQDQLGSHLDDRHFANAVKQLGNAVTPPPMSWLIMRCVTSLHRRLPRGGERLTSFPSLSRCPLSFSHSTTGEPEVLSFQRKLVGTPGFEPGTP